jgi:diketogulonate reductase-like aldo/keto reductase
MTQRLWYGTAWKEDRTEELVALALRTGFRAIDTANQRKHYVEAGVGAALTASGIPRAELVIQTKFTHAAGQDHRLPYDPRAPIAAQVEQSFASSCEHLGTTYVDAYVLHGPSWTTGLAPADVEAWRAIEALATSGRARAIGISNVSAAQLRELCGLARVAPAYVQNRCYARTGWDAEVRAICRERGIAYQAFSLLTANRRELAAVRPRAGFTVEQMTFAFARQAGMIALTGTSSEAHMRADLAAGALELTPSELAMFG